jgi:phage terminase Nu1 subunit (DNA packaging protein)
MTKELITRRQLAFRLGVHPRTIIRWEKQGMPVYKSSVRHPRYIYEEVEQWLTEMSNVDVS